MLKKKEKDMSNAGRRREAEGSGHVVIENNPQAVGTERGYNVVFEGTGGGRSNHIRVRTWTPFENKDAFIKWMQESENGDKVIAEGVTQDEALKYTRQTKLVDQIAAAVAQSTTKNGEVDPTTLRLHLTNLAMLKHFRSGE